MSLMAVKMSEEVWLTCLAHSLTTETEEIMGLLFGDIKHVNGRGAIALIWGASPQVRSDRRKDRVEVQPEQLAAASAQAERMTLTAGRTTRVIGWYHSHPHITVLPSHVDVRTQAMYQQLDPGFIGLIFSCFSEDAQKVGRGSSGTTDFFSHDVNYLGKQRKRDSSLLPNSADSFNNNAHDVDSMDMTASMQEALHRSNMDMSGAEYVRKEVPLEVMPSKALLKLDSPLASFVDMQNVLFEEERTAYNQGILQNTRNGKIHPLTYIHHTSTYQASLCKLMEYCLSPAINTLQSQLKENEIRLAQLAEEAKSLELEALALKPLETNTSSHRHLLSHSPRGSSSPGQHGARAAVDPYDARSPGGARSQRKAP